MDVINIILMKVLEFGVEYPKVNTVLVIFGGLVFLATVLKPVVYVIVNWTKTDKDDAVADKIYGVIEGTAIDFKPFVDLFKKKYPKFEMSDKNE